MGPAKISNTLQSSSPDATPEELEAAACLPHEPEQLESRATDGAPVVDYLEEQPEVGDMLAQIEGFLARWLPAFEDDQRSYLTVAIGCTGGQHRSVYFVEVLARRFAARGATLVRHRELDART